MNSESPLISVIVPCYNYANYLPDLIGSLVKQSHQNWECILIDDGSEDNTSEVANEFVKKDPRIRYVHQKNAGPAAARSNGVKLALGYYIQFIDADDLIGADKFKLELEIFAQNKTVDIVYSEYEFIDTENKKKWKDEKKWMTLSAKPFNDLVKYWEAGLMIPIHSFLFSKKCFDKWGSFDPQFKTHEDWDLDLNFSLKGAIYVHHNYCGAYYRIHPVSSSRTDVTKNRKDTVNVLLKYLRTNSCTFFQKMLIRKRYCEFAADFFVERVKYKRMRFFEVFNFNNAHFLFPTAILLLPFFLFRKLIKRIF